MDSSLTYRLGNGVSGTVGSDTFPRVLNQQPYDTEELRLDTPTNLALSSSYIGLALSGSSTSAAVWNIVKTSYDSNGNESRKQFLVNIAWSTRASAAWPS